MQGFWEKEAYLKAAGESQGGLDGRTKVVAEKDGVADARY